MNKTKVERLLKNINEVINEDIPTNAEYIVLLANMLRVFAIAGIEKDNRLALTEIFLKQTRLIFLYRNLIQLECKLNSVASLAPL